MKRLCHLKNINNNHFDILTKYPFYEYYMKLYIVDFSAVEKQLRMLPKETIKRLQRWVIYIETIGLMETRKIPGFHDKSLKGKWKGYRSVRLGYKWRVIYKHDKNSMVNIIRLQEITPHEY